MGEVVVYGSHPAVAVPDSIYVEDPGSFLNTWARQNFLDYGLVPAFLFCIRQFGQDVCSCVMSSGDMLNLGRIELGDFFSY
ncbi:hypothetical protein A2U01_0054794 [Trifolium medium]|uniref:Uncharacterized protein n=1 Tax=Trifolium medium TaxID=97028 RepID=A0A392RBK8_9FABA|nr:hypothetical protein [Trifolium medium]